MLPCRYPGPSSISVCFNGGKDCIAVLHLFHAAFQKKYPGEKMLNFYVKEPEPFEEVIEYIQEAEKVNRGQTRIINNSLGTIVRPGFCPVA